MAPPASTDRRVLSHDEALSAARRRFVATGDLKMASLARDLNVSRATVYRVVTSRDQLLGDVLWQLARRTLDAAIHDVAQQDLVGVERFLAISHRFHEQVAGFEPMRRLLREQSADTFRVLFTAAGGVHERMVGAWAELLQEALDSGELGELPFEVHETAYVYVRIGESMLYGDMLAGVVPDIELGDRVRRTILQGH